MADSANIKLLAFHGSIRKNSYGMAVLNTIAETFQERVPITIHSLADIPLFNSDLEESELPESVSTLKDAIENADGLIVSTPEYNYGVSGVLKNALDWASRPGYQSVLRGKPVLVMAESMAITGGVRALVQLRTTLSAILARTVSGPDIAIGQVHTLITDGRLVDEKSLRYISTGIDELIAEIQRLRR